MASIETGKELMEDSLKHIDELFRSQLGSAGVTPPAGVFEQCVRQLQASGTQGQELNQGATQNGVQSGGGNAVGSAGKTIFGFSLKASVATLGTVVATVLVVSAIMQKMHQSTILKKLQLVCPKQRRRLRLLMQCLREMLAIMISTTLLLHQQIQIL